MVQVRGWERIGRDEKEGEEREGRERVRRK